MGWFKNIAPLVGGVAGWALGGPLGGLVGSTLGGAVGGGFGSQQQPSFGSGIGATGDAGQAAGGAWADLGVSAKDMKGPLMQMAFSAWSQKQQMKQMEYFYKHRYQWQAEDMRAAGINPNSGGSAPAVGSVAPIDAEIPNFNAQSLKSRELDIMSAKTGSYIQVQQETVKRIQEDVELLRAHVANAKQENEIREVKLPYEINNLISQNAKLMSEVDLQSYEQGLLRVRKAILDQEFQSIKNEGELHKKLAELLGPAGAGLVTSFAKVLGSSLGSVLSGAIGGYIGARR